jgi:nucleoside-diphosphate-sugar epimerase
LFQHVFEHTLPVASPPSRVIVLGAGGFVGRVVVDQLRVAGIPAVAVSSRDVDLSRPASTGQLRGVLRPTDSIVLLSAITREKGRDGRTFMTNVAMAHHVANAAAGQCRHVVYVSSDAVYGEEPHLPITEGTTLAPTDLYGLAHLARERVILEACAAGGTPVAVLRPTMLYGAGDTHRSYGPNRFLRTLMETGTITLFGNGEETRDYVHVDDFASLVLLCLERSSHGPINVATGCAVTVRCVAELLSAMSGASTSVISQPRIGDATHRVFDIAALTSAFPQWTPRTLEDGLRSTWAAALQ